MEKYVILYLNGDEEITEIGITDNFSQLLIDRKENYDVYFWYKPNTILMQI